MSLTTRVYIGVVIGTGAMVLGTFAPRDLTEPLLAVTCLTAMLVVSLFKLRLPLGTGHSTMSMAYVVDFAVIVTAGADLAMVIAAFGVFVQCLANVRRPQPWYRTAFSVATVVLAVHAAGLVWTAAGGVVGVPPAAAVLPLMAAAVPYFMINSGLVAAAIALSNGLSPLRYWSRSFLATAPGVLAAAAVVAAIEVTMTRDAYLLLATAVAPMALCHAAYAAWIKRTATTTPVMA